MNEAIFPLSILVVLVSTLCFWGMKQFSVALGMIDQPVARSSHSHPTPKGGGLGFLVALLVLVYFYPLPWYIILPIVSISLLSFWGDRRELFPWLRVVFQGVFSIVFIRYGCELIQSFTLSYTLLGVFTFLTLFLVGTSNVYNFMDGINGIATLTAIVYLWLFFVYDRLYSLNHPLIK